MLISTVSRLGTRMMRLCVNNSNNNHNVVPISSIIPRINSSINNGNVNMNTLLPPLLLPTSVVSSNNASHNNTIIRTWKWSKQRKKREARYRRRQAMLRAGIPIPKPDKYIDPKTPVVNAPDKAEAEREKKQFDETSARELSEKLQKAQGDTTGGEVRPQLRYHMNSNTLQISDRVMKLLKLTNGSQREVVRAQRQLGMDVFKKHQYDTGSSIVQVVAITTRIQNLNRHFVRHRKDFSGKRRLLHLVNRRRKLLNYMERQEFDDYRKIVKTLGLQRK